MTSEPKVPSVSLSPGDAIHFEGERRITVGSLKIWGAVLGLSLLMSIGAIGVICPLMFRSAEREHAAYARLCDLGAWGDDWISLREFITGRPPIIELEIPAGVAQDEAFRQLPALVHLEYLSLEYDHLSEADILAIGELSLTELTLLGKYPSDNDIDQLARLSRVQSLSIRDGNLSEQALRRLDSLLPSTSVDEFTLSEPQAE